MGALSRSSSIASGLLVAVSLLASGPASAQRKSVSVRFSPKGGMHELVAKVLGYAKSEIAIAMYSVSPGQVAMWEPLRAAVARGAKCTVILNGAKSSNKSKAAAFAGLGCDVRAVSGTMHNKFVVVDRLHTCTGSSNWSKGAEEKYSENRICYVKYPGIASDYLAEFQRLLARSMPYTQSGRYPRAPAQPGTMPTDSDKDGITNIFTSQNSRSSALLTQALVSAIKGARSSIDVAVANFNASAIKNAICAAQARGITVRVLSDQGQFSIRTSKVKALEACKVPVRYIVYGLAWYHPYAQLMHHKFAIIDKTILLTGSYNWSDTAERSNAENLQVIVKSGRKNSSLVNAFQREMNSLWNLKRTAVSKLVSAFTTTQPKCQPIHWDTSYLNLRVSLVRPEYTKIRSKAYGAGLGARVNQSKRCVVPEKKQFLSTVPKGTKFITGL